MRDTLRAALAAWALGLGVLSAAAASPAAAAPPTPDPAAPETKPPTDTVVRFADWVAGSGDNGGLPFVIIDKVEAEVFVFDAKGRLSGAAPALIGFAQGDDSVPGIGDRELSHIRPEERTTPAGRFVAAYGPGHDGEPVLWVDYETAISMHSLHQVSLPNPRERRQQRLNSPTPLDNRITYGCINLPDAFYEGLVRPTFTGTEGVVYILPEARPLEEVFPAFTMKPVKKKPRGWRLRALLGGGS